MWEISYCSVNIRIKNILQKLPMNSPRNVEAANNTVSVANGMSCAGSQLRSALDSDVSAADCPLHSTPRDMDSATPRQIAGQSHVQHALSDSSPEHTM